MRYGWLLLLAAGCAGETGSEDPVADILALTGDAANGGTLYDSNCAVCHGDNGEGDSGPSLQEGEEASELAEVIWFGEGDMAGYSELLTAQDAADIIAYVEDAIVGATTLTPPGEM